MNQNETKILYMFLSHQTVKELCSEPFDCIGYSGCDQLKKQKLDDFYELYKTK